MNVLLSIKPKYVDEILAGKKKFEFRKAIFKKRDISKVFIYASSPVKKIVASFEIARIIEDSPQNLWKQCSEYAGIPEKDFFDYYKTSDIGYAIEITNFEKISEPIDPYVLKKDFRPPQSYCYLPLDYFDRKVKKSLKENVQETVFLESNVDYSSSVSDKQNKLKGKKKEYVISDVEKNSNDLPEGWTWVELKDLTDNPKKDIVDGPFGSNLRSNEYTETGVPVFKIQNIKENRFVDKNINFVSPSKAEELSRHSFQKGDLIITKLGNPLGLCCKVPEKYPMGIIVADLIRLRPSSQRVDTQYLMYGINSIVVQNQFKVITKGTTRPRVNLTIVRGIQFPLPPLPEQRAIVSKIEQLFSELDNGISNLKLAQEQLKVYRQAVLKKAFEGAFISGINDYKDVTINAIPSKIPSSWKVSKIGDYAKLQGGFAFKSKEYTSSGVPIVKISNVHYEKIDWKDKTFISKDRIEEFRDYSLEDGDILIAMTRPVIKSLNTVKTVIVSKQDLPALLNQRVGRFKVSEELSKAYLKYFIYTDFFKKPIIRDSSSTQQPNISSKKVESFDFIFPDNPGLQQAIVREIETHLSVCDKLEQDISENLEKAEVLRQSILKKAFEGKLLDERELEEVRNAPDWEPAEELLERVKAEKKGKK